MMINREDERSHSAPRTGHPRFTPGSGRMMINREDERSHSAPRTGHPRFTPGSRIL